MSDIEQAVTEVHRKIYWDGSALTIGPDSDGLGCVRLHTATKDAEEYWGKLDVSFPPGLAIALGEALIQAAKETKP